MVLKEQVLICQQIHAPSTKVPVACDEIDVFLLSFWDWGLLSAAFQKESQCK